MALYALGLAAIAHILYDSGVHEGTDRVVTFLEHFAEISDALETRGVWDAEDGFFYDQLRTADGTVPVKVRSMVGVIPLLATAVVDEAEIAHAESAGQRAATLLRRDAAAQGSHQAVPARLRGEMGHRRLLLSAVTPDQLRRVLGPLLDENEFLSPGGLRSLSRRYLGKPYVLTTEGGTAASVDYEPAESTTAMFGGNSNWRGPVWFPLNYLLVDCLQSFHDFYGDEFRVEYPTGSGNLTDLGAVAADLRRRLIALFLVGPDGRRPCFGEVERMQTDPDWRDHLLFNEYFHGDTGAGLGASHQTGWTGLVADLICARRR
jgi:hypothetical protein